MPRRSSGVSGDSLAAALETSEQLADPRNYTAWRDYGKLVLEGCPTLVERVSDYPTWWPALTDLMRDLRMAPATFTPGVPPATGGVATSR